MCGIRFKIVRTIDRENLCFFSIYFWSPESFLKSSNIDFGFLILLAVLFNMIMKSSANEESDYLFPFWTVTCSMLGELCNFHSKGLKNFVFFFIFLKKHLPFKNKHKDSTLEIISFSNLKMNMSFLYIFSVLWKLRLGEGGDLFMPPCQNIIW